MRNPEYKECDTKRRKRLPGQTFSATQPGNIWPTGKNGDAGDLVT